MPLEVRDGKWHHICITWTTRDGQWEAYQDGSKRGYGDNLAAWHPIKAGGVIILGQEQVQKCRRSAKHALLKTTNLVIFNFPVLKVTRTEDNLHIENLPTNGPIVYILLFLILTGCGGRALRCGTGVCGRAESGKHLGQSSEVGRDPVHG